MTDEWIWRVEVVYMSAQGAHVIDLAEYRRRRASKNELRAAVPAVQPVVWVPVWMWVPFWSM